MDSNSLVWMDVDSNEVTRTTELGTRSPGSVAVDPTGTTVFVTYVREDYSGGLIALDSTSDKELWDVETGVETKTVAVLPDGSTAYVVNTHTTADHGTVSVVDTSSAEVVGNIQMGQYPSDAVSLPDGTAVLVTDLDGLSILE